MNKNILLFTVFFLLTKENNASFFTLFTKKNKTTLPEEIEHRMPAVDAFLNYTLMIWSKKNSTYEQSFIKIANKEFTDNEVNCFFNPYLSHRKTIIEYLRNPSFSVIAFDTVERYTQQYAPAIINHIDECFMITTKNNTPVLLSDLSDFFGQLSYVFKWNKGFFDEELKEIDSMITQCKNNVLWGEGNKFLISPQLRSQHSLTSLCVATETKIKSIPFEGKAVVENLRTWRKEYHLKHKIIDNNNSVHLRDIENRKPQHTSLFGQTYLLKKLTALPKEKEEEKEAGDHVKRKAEEDERSRYHLIKNYLYYKIQFLNKDIEKRTEEAARAQDGVIDKNMFNPYLTNRKKLFDFLCRECEHDGEFSTLAAYTNRNFSKIQKYLNDTLILLFDDKVPCNYRIAAELFTEIGYFISSGSFVMYNAVHYGIQVNEQKEIDNLLDQCRKNIGKGHGNTFIFTSFREDNEPQMNTHGLDYSLNTQLLRGKNCKATDDFIDLSPDLDAFIFRWGGLLSPKALWSEHTEEHDFIREYLYYTLRFLRKNNEKKEIAQHATLDQAGNVFNYALTNREKLLQFLYQDPHYEPLYEQGVPESLKEYSQKHKKQIEEYITTTFVITTKKNKEFAAPLVANFFTGITFILRTNPTVFINECIELTNFICECKSNILDGKDNCFSFTATKSYPNSLNTILMKDEAYLQQGSHSSKNLEYGKEFITHWIQCRTYQPEIIHNNTYNLIENQSKKKSSSIPFSKEEQHKIATTENYLRHQLRFYTKSNQQEEKRLMRTIDTNNHQFNDKITHRNELTTALYEEESGEFATTSNESVDTYVQRCAPKILQRIQQKELIITIDDTEECHYATLATTMARELYCMKEQKQLYDEHKNFIGHLRWEVYKNAIAHLPNSVNRYSVIDYQSNYLLEKLILFPNKKIDKIAPNIKNALWHWQMKRANYIARYPAYDIINAINWRKKKTIEDLLNAALLFYNTNYAGLIKKKTNYKTIVGNAFIDITPNNSFFVACPDLATFTETYAQSVYDNINRHFEIRIASLGGDCHLETFLEFIMGVWYFKQKHRHRYNHHYDIEKYIKKAIQQNIPLRFYSEDMQSFVTRWTLFMHPANNNAEQQWRKERRKKETENGFKGKTIRFFLTNTPIEPYIPKGAPIEMQGIPNYDDSIRAKNENIVGHHTAIMKFLNIKCRQLVETVSENNTMQMVCYNNRTLLIEKITEEYPRTPEESSEEYLFHYGDAIRRYIKENFTVKTKHNEPVSIKHLSKLLAEIAYKEHHK